MARISREERKEKMKEPETGLWQEGGGDFLSAKGVRGEKRCDVCKKEKYSLLPSEKGTLSANGKGTD